MNLVYTTTTDDFQPISYGDSYLFDNYSRLISFLKTRLNSSELNRVSKPLLIASRNIEWYSIFNAPMKPLNNFGEEQQISIEREYLELIKKIERIIGDFKKSQDKDKEEWAQILSLVFKPSDNKLLSNGVDWVFIWGWQFRNKLIIQNPDFNIPVAPSQIETIKDEQKDNSELTNEFESEIDSPELEEIREIPKIEEPISVLDPIIPIVPVVPIVKTRISFWERIKRFFRWITYRFWGLMMLIVFVLLILCLCKHCCRKEDDCSKYQDIDKELKMLEKRVKERCPKTTVESSIAR
jgi:hypothetical protein